MAYTLNTETNGLVTRDEAIARFCRGGRGITRWLRVALTKEGPETYQALTQRQRVVWRAMIASAQKHDGNLRYTLKNGESRNPVDELRDWGAIDGQWKGVCFIGKIGEDMLRDRPTFTPKELPDRLPDDKQKPKQEPDMESARAEGKPKLAKMMADIRSKYQPEQEPEQKSDEVYALKEPVFADIPAMSPGISTGMTMTISIMSCVIGASLGVLFTLAFTQ